MGSFLNVNIIDKYNKSSHYENGKFTPYKRHIFMHEYGHTIASQMFGLAYLFAIGIPSALGSQWTEDIANNHGKWYFMDNWIER